MWVSRRIHCLIQKNLFSRLFLWHEASNALCKLEPEKRISDDKPIIGNFTELIKMAPRDMYL